jgi:CRISPR system Cascade subunit CasA
MTLEFNLVDRPWIPCVLRNGEAITLGLRDVLREAHEIRALAVDSPLELAALHRLLLAIVHRNFGPEGGEAWEDLWLAERFDPAPLEDYWKEWRPRFDLLDEERPFYQAPDDRVKEKPPNSLILDTAFGNKATLFDHNTDEEGIMLSPAKAARAVVTLQAFGLAGLAGIRGDTFTEGTCTSGVIFFVQGDTLFETLMLNLLPYPTWDTVLVHQPEDRPAWEMEDPYQPERTRPLGYLDYLTWQNRHILLMPQPTSAGPMITAITMAPALRLDDDILDPMKHYRRDSRRGPLPLRFQEDRALWRDSAALFKLSSDDYRPPETFRWLAELVDDDVLDAAQTRRYMALGMAKSRAKVEFYRAERMPLPMQYLAEETLVERLDEALKMAENVRGQLWGAARTLAKFILSPQADQESGREPDRGDMDNLMTQWAVERDYWVRLEIPFQQLVETLPQNMTGSMQAWDATLRRVAWDALERIAGELEHRPRHLKAAVQARGQLGAGLKKVLPEPVMAESQGNVR